MNDKDAQAEGMAAVRRQERQDARVRADAEAMKTANHTPGCRAGEIDAECPCEQEAGTMPMTNDTLIGRGFSLVRQFTDDLSRSFGGPPMAEKRRRRLNRNRISRLLPRGAGGWFEVMLVDDEGRDTGFIARVTVTYERFDADAANAR